MRTTRRALAALVPALLLLPLLPGSAQAGHIAVRGTAIACPPDQVSSSAESGFADIAGGTFETQINCLSDYGVAKGTGPGTYSPGSPVLRRQMALFLTRVGTLAGVPFDTRDAGFTDLGGLDQTTRDAVNGLANAGIARGVDGTRFSPGTTVTRGQMASFLDRLERTVNGTGYDVEGDFFDDDASSVHQDAINALATAGIAAGTGERSYSPEREVTRAQMAGFLTRVLDVLVERGDVRSAYGGGPVAVTPAESAERTATANPDATADDDRTYTATGLVPGEEYRVTLVLADHVLGSGGAVRFVRDAATGLADVGARTADVTTVDGARARDNSGDGTPLTDVDPAAAGTAVVVGDADGTSTFVVDGDQGGEGVRPVLHPNGGAEEELEDGGTKPGLEVAEDGAPLEPVAVGGLLTVVEQGLPTVTERPELVSTGVVRTRTDPGPTAASTDDRQLTDVRYVFDERVTGKAPAANRFHLVGADSAVRYDGTRAVTEAGGTSVLVTFGAASTPALPQGQDVGQAQLLSIALATVDVDAVRDASGFDNPVGDDLVRQAALSSTGTTSAPDLLRLTALGGTGTEAGRLAVHFDQPAFVVAPSGFHVVTLSGVDLTCTPAAGSGAGEQVVPLDCPESPAGGPLQLAEVGRAYVAAGTVSNARQDAVPGADGTTNPLQATGVPHDDTAGPDLVSAVVLPAGTTGALDTITFVFDVTVDVLNESASLSGPDPDGAGGQNDFRAYTSAGGAGTNPVRVKEVREKQVTVEYPRGTAASLVGVNVAENAVFAAGTALGRANQEDETSTLSLFGGDGPTDAPDLLVVVLDGAAADFVFDEDVAADNGDVPQEEPPADESSVADEELRLGLADGTTLVCKSAAAAGRTVRCSTFEVMRPGTDDQVADESLVGAAVLGWVDDGTVRDAEVPANQSSEQAALVGSAPAQAG